MNIRDKITSNFDGWDFERPIFYCFEPALRFELAEGDGYLTCFLSALNKAKEICEYILGGENSFICCLRTYDTESPDKMRSYIKQFKYADIEVPKKREYWTRRVVCEDGSGYFNTVCFKLPIEDLLKIVWFGVGSDTSCIEPRCNAEIFILSETVDKLIWIYDDRGMDVVCKDFCCLQKIFKKFDSYLLDYDRERIEGFFSDDKNMVPKFLSSGEIK